MQKLVDWGLSLYVFFSLVVVFIFSNIFSDQDNAITYENTIFCMSIISFISLLSYVSTWRRLNNYYATKLESPNKVKIFKSGRVGFVSYGNCLKIGVLEQGIYLSSLLSILAYFNKPLLIPWSDIIEVLADGNNSYTIKIRNANFSTKLSLPVDSLKDAEDILKAKMK
ncbi:MAG: hypothetical protein AAF383_26990 [Cyanobacteria bacterium P01_A01_bin.83]